MQSVPKSHVLTHIKMGNISFLSDIDQNIQIYLLLFATLMKATSVEPAEISKSATSMQALHSLQMPQPHGAMHTLVPV